MPEKPTVTDMMVAYAQDAVDMAKANFGVELDYSEASVQKVEECLTKLHDTIPKGFLGKLLGRGPSADDILQVSKMFGGYVGEVFRKYHGGAWLVEPAPGSDGPVVTLQHSNGGKFWPSAKVHKRLVNGPEDNVWVYYRVLTREYIKK
jgi:hypothetical protein